MTLQNGWVNYGAGYATARYTRTELGVVVLSGLIKSGDTTNPTLLGQLPAEYAPNYRLILEQAANVSNPVRVDITTTGQVLLLSSPSTASGWLSLDGLTFLAGDAPATTAAVPFTNGWTNYSYGYSPLQTSLDGAGRVHLQGLVNPGTTTDGTPLGTLATGHRPDLYLHLSAATSGGLGTVGASTTSAVAKGTTGWLAPQALFYPAAKAASWSALTLQNNWVATGGAYATPGVVKATDGIVTLRGLMRSGTVTSGTVLATLPVGSRPAAAEIFDVSSALDYARVDVYADGRVIAKEGTSATWLALDSISFMAEQ